MDRIIRGYGEMSNGILIGTVGLLLVFICWEWILEWLRMNVAFWRIPGPMAYPFIGNAFMFIGGPTDFFRVIRDCRNKYGTLFRLWIGTKPFLFLCGGEVVQPILSSSVHIKKSGEYVCIEPWLGTGLITSSGSKWHMRRKLLTGAFHSTLLEGYMESLDKGAIKMVNVLMNHTPKDSPAEWSEAINISHYTKLSALDAICDTIMGYNINALEGNSNLEYINAIERVNLILQHRFITPWLLSDFIFYRTSHGKEFSQKVQIIQKFTNQVIRERREEISSCKEEGNKEPTEREESSERPKRKSFLDLLLDLSDNGRILSDEDIREEVDTFMFAGHDTTSAAIDWSLYTLGHHPEAQTRILEEAESILGEDGNTKLTVSQINRMEYLDRFTKEVLRMYPSVPMIGRELESPVTINGFTIPPKTSINLSIFVLHRDPTHFPNPDKFDPDRFLHSETAGRHSFAYAPFSAGSRNCIGQKLGLLQVKIMILRLMQNLEVKSLCKEEDLIIRGEITLKSPNGIPLSFRKRQ